MPRAVLFLAALLSCGCAAHQASALAPRLIARATVGEQSTGSWRWSLLGGLEWRLARPEPPLEEPSLPGSALPSNDLVPCRSASLCAWEHANVAAARARLVEERQ